MKFAHLIAVATAGLIAAALPSAVPAAAQTQPQDQAAPSPGQSRQLVISREKFDAFIDVAIAVQRIRDAWKEKIKAADSRVEAEQMIEAARLEMTQAVESATGISLPEYVAIASAARQSRQLAQAIERQIRAKQGAGD